MHYFYMESFRSDQSHTSTILIGWIKDHNTQRLCLIWRVLINFSNGKRSFFISLSTTNVCKPYSLVGDIYLICLDVPLCKVKIWWYNWKNPKKLWPIEISEFYFSYYKNLMVVEVFPLAQCTQAIWLASIWNAISVTADKYIDYGFFIKTKQQKTPQMQTQSLWFASNIFKLKHLM